MKIEQSAVYMQMAMIMASKSKATRKKVGAVLVTVNGVIIPGYNGTFPSHDNQCEDLFGNTFPEVIHAEMNVMAKACREGVSTQDATLYVTLSPCMDCAKLLSMSGVKAVYYTEAYRNTAGIDYLISCGIDVEQMR